MATRMSHEHPGEKVGDSVWISTFVRGSDQFWCFFLIPGDDQSRLFPRNSQKLIN